jgi:hypothetical protein
MKEMFEALRGWVGSKLGRKKPVMQPERVAT